MNMEEIWRDIPGYEGYYQASNLGRIRSLDRVVKHRCGGTAVKKGKVLKLQKREQFNYVKYLVGLTKDKYEFRIVSRLVWSAFNGPIPDGMQVNHIDENPLNNNLDNLNIMSSKENCNWGTRNKRCAKNNTNHPGKSKTIVQFDLYGNFIREWESEKEIKRKLNYANSNISSCCCGHRNTAYGYVWKYKEEKAIA